MYNRPLALKQSSLTPKFQSLYRGFQTKWKILDSGTCSVSLEYV